MCQRYATACVSSLQGNGNEVDGACSVVYDWFQIDTSCHTNGVVRMAFGSIRSIGLEMEIVRNVYGVWQYPPSRSQAHEVMKRRHAHRWWRQWGDSHKRQGLALKDLNIFMTNAWWGKIPKKCQNTGECWWVGMVSANNHNVAIVITAPRRAGSVSHAATGNQAAWLAKSCSSVVHIKRVRTQEDDKLVMVIAEASATPVEATLLDDMAEESEEPEEERWNTSWSIGSIVVSEFGEQK